MSRKKKKRLRKEVPANPAEIRPLDDGTVESIDLFRRQLRANSHTLGAPPPEGFKPRTSAERAAAAHQQVVNEFFADVDTTE